MCSPDAAPPRLTAKTLAAWRVATVAAQGGVCALCGEPFSDKNPPVGDHDHRTGQMRGVLHRGCNTALGAVENNAARCFLTDPVKLARWSRALAYYIHKARDDAPYYPTHRTEEQKRERRNTKARAARAKRAAN